MKSISILMTEMRDAGAPMEVILLAISAVEEVTTELRAHLVRGFGA